MRSIFYFCFSLLTLSVFSQVNVTSTIDAATVFQRGAQVFRTATVAVPKGETTLSFGSLPRDLDPNSIILGGTGKLSVLSVSHNPNHQITLDEHPKIIAITTQLETVKQSLLDIASKEAGLILEREVFEQTRAMGGNTGLTLNEIKAATDFARKRREQNAREWYALQTEKEALTKQQSALNQELNTTRQRLKLVSGEVLVKVVSEAAVNATFSLSYIVQQASWTSAYDAKVNDLSKPVNLTHKALITQNTGEDWNSIDLVLATGNPSASAQVPYMGTWFVNVNNVAVQGNASAKLRNANTFAVADDAESPRVAFQQNGASLNQNLTQQEFTIKRKQNLKSSSTPVTVVLRELELPAKYEYQAKPRLDPDAFLVAKVYNWGRFDLLSGELSLFNNNTFVGKAYLSTDVPQDTLQLSLGRDKSIKLSRQRIYTKQEKSFFGNDRIDHYVWRIELRNNKKLPVNIVLRDQVPVSQSEEIKVTVKSVGGGNYDEKSGIIKWRLSLAPGAQQAYEVAYEVKYPKEQRVRYY